MARDLESDGVAAIVGGVHDRLIEPQARLEAHVRRHAISHARLNALVQARHESARIEARAEAAHDGPLAGVTVSVKECFPVRGLKTTLGIPARRSIVDDDDAEIVVRLKHAGAILVGKANVPQAMYGFDSDNPVWGRTNHPDRPDRGPGGSSGGDAALVAAGVVSLGIGTDLAGSMRQPAHACGVCSILPRSSVIGDGGGFDTMPHLHVVRPRTGFIARHVSDLETVMAALDLSGRREPADARLRVGWWDESGPLEPSPAVRRAVHHATDGLRSAGIDVVELSASINDEAAWLHLAILSSDGGRSVRRLFAGCRPIPGVARSLGIARLPRGIRPALAAFARLVGRGIEADAVAATGPRSKIEFTQLIERRTRLADRIDAAWRSTEGAAVDAIVCPVFAVPAMRHDTASQLLIAAAPCFLANLLDLPAGVVPVTRVRPDETARRGSSRDPVVQAALLTDQGSEGLPVGVQVIALDGRESTVLTVMRWIEKTATL